MPMWTITTNIAFIVHYIMHRDVDVPVHKPLLLCPGKFLKTRLKFSYLFIANVAYCSGVLYTMAKSVYALQPDI